MTDLGYSLQLRRGFDRQHFSGITSGFGVSTTAGEKYDPHVKGFVNLLVEVSVGEPDQGVIDGEGLPVVGGVAGEVDQLLLEIAVVHEVALLEALLRVEQDERRVFADAHLLTEGLLLMTVDGGYLDNTIELTGDGFVFRNSLLTMGTPRSCQSKAVCVEINLP